MKQGFGLFLSWKANKYAHIFADTQWVHHIRWKRDDTVHDKLIYVGWNLMRKLQAPDFGKNKIWHK